MHMRSKIIGMICLVVFISGTASSFVVHRIAKAGDPVRSTRGQTTQQSTKASKNYSPIPAPHLLVPPDPAQVYTVEPLPVRGKVQPRTHEQEQILKDAAAIVSKVKPIPAERIQFFNWMNAIDSPVTFAGWGIFVDKVAVTPEGWLITLRAHALAISKGGRHTNVANFFIEEYTWNGSGLKYIRGYADPVLGNRPVITSL